MNSVEKIEKRYNEGLHILEAFMKMTDQEIREKLRSIVGNQITNNEYLLGDNSQIKRVIENELPSEITVSYYDHIKISPFGINYEGEHGYNNRKLVEFNEHFKL